MYFCSALVLRGLGDIPGSLPTVGVVEHGIRSFGLCEPFFPGRSIVLRTTRSRWVEKSPSRLLHKGRWSIDAAGMVLSTQLRQLERPIREFDSRRGHKLELGRPSAIPFLEACDCQGNLWLAAGAFGLVIFRWLNVLSPCLILFCVFLIGDGFAFNAPVSTAIVAQLVTETALSRDFKWRSGARWSFNPGNRCQSDFHGNRRRRRDLERVGRDGRSEQRFAGSRNPSLNLCSSDYGQRTGEEICRSVCDNQSRLIAKKFSGNRD